MSHPLANNFGFGTVSVSKILVHPIKSCKGTPVPSAKYTPRGLEFDRNFCIISSDDSEVITIREMPRMVLITPTIILEEGSPHRGRLEISFPAYSGCETFSVPLCPSQDLLNTWPMLEKVSMFNGAVYMDGYITSAITPGRSPSEILTSYFGKAVHLIYDGPLPRACPPTTSFPQLEATTVFGDAYPLLLLSEESVEAVEEKVKEYVGQQGVEQRWEKERLDIERFRPNIILRGGGAFCEDAWEEISIRGLSRSADTTSDVLLVAKCARCLLPNVAPDTGIRDAAVPYKVMAKFRTGLDPADKYKPCLGSYGVPLLEGEVHVGDSVVVRKVTSS